MKYGFGIDVGGTSVKLALFDLEGNIVEKWSIPTRTEDGGKHVLPDIAASVLECLEKKEISRQDVIGIGVGIPGPVSEDGIVNRCVNLGWGVVDLHGELGRLTGFPICSGNDANVATLGECWKGSGDGSRFMVMVTLGTGIGGGIILNGKLLQSCNNAAGELGHMTIQMDGETCCCGKKGCFEAYGSASALIRQAREATGEDITEAKTVFDRAAAGDGRYIAVLDRYHTYLAEGFANIINILGPDYLCIGGGVSAAGDALLKPVRQKTYARVFAKNAEKNTQIVLARLHNDAGILGAAMLER